MSLESANSFLDKLNEDADFRQQFMEIKSPDGVMVKAKEEGYDFTQEEVQEAMSARPGMPKLSEDQLDAIVGGDASTWVSASGAASGAAVAAGAAAAACL